jgi:hypothetical protein
MTDGIEKVIAGIGLIPLPLPLNLDCPVLVLGC